MTEPLLARPGRARPSRRPGVRAPLRRGALALGLLTALLGAGCKKPGGLEGELAALKTAGHSLGGFAKSEERPFQAKACQSGSLDGLAAVLCEYGSAEALRLGQQGAEAWIGQARTGVVLRRDLFLLALSDREAKDPNGRAVAALSRSFRRK